jgi:hypothetical protein
MPQRIQTGKWNGRLYDFCTVCRRYGRQGWTHICNGSNWFASPAELEASLQRSERELTGSVLYTDGELISRR